MYHLDQGQSYLPDKQTSLEDRYYNNKSFQEEYPVNDPEVNKAASILQAAYRGNKARQNVEKMKQETNIDTEQQDLDYRDKQSATPNQGENYVSPNEVQKSSPFPSARSEQQDNKNDTDRGKKENEQEKEEDQIFEVEIPEVEKEEQERAARSIQAKFRGYQARKTPNREQGSPGSVGAPEQLSDQRPHQESDNEKTPTPTPTRLSGKIDSDRRDLGGNLTANDQIETGENDDTDRPRLEREPTQLSEDFERHTQVPRNSDFPREQQSDLNNDEDDMNDPNLDKAATRIQASFRGYKTRKELGSGVSHEQQQHPSSTSPHIHDEYDNAHNKNNKEAEGEEDDNAAAVKIQAAYRGYRVRKDLEK